MLKPPVRSQEAIAIVGIGCRLPGDISTPESFWQALVEELDVVGEVLTDRWNIDGYYHPDRNRPGTTYTRAAAMLPDLQQFDAAFFGIAPQEASRIDPQHRLLLEVAWEALEDAGLPTAALVGQNVGVFIGQSFQDYLALQLRDPGSENAYTMMGGASCMAANRLSYFLDLRGPSVTIDTACASGLTSVHAACQSIASGESSMALCGATNVSLVPGGFVGFSRAQMLSPSGRCQAFAAAADGYVRGEGCGVIVLKPLAAALAAGDRIYAVIRATGINHHGHSQGITFPGVDAQEELLRTVVQRAGVSAHEIQYVEAHGTGTQAGDPVEATAIGRALGQGRSPAAPLRIGSAKTNFGHAEAAAGIVGLIKLALSLQHQLIPRSLHADTTNPKIPFAALGLKVANQAEPWPASEGPARGLVSAFGFGGANACALLEVAPRAPKGSEPGAAGPSSHGPFLLPLSARSEEGLRALALSWVGRLRESAVAPLDLCYTAALRRDRHEHRLALAFRDTADLATLLGTYLRVEESARVLTGRTRGRGSPHKVAFAFCGNGPQWWAMGRQLLAQEPVFRKVVERCAKAFSAISDYDLFAELGASEAMSRMSRTDVAQPAIYALQIGLCELLASWGIRPDGVLGHSAGEGASAYIAGALDFDDAIKVIYHRCRTQQLTEGSGRLAAAGLSLNEAEQYVAPFVGRVCISAHNSPRQVTFSGELLALRELGQRVQASGAFWREIPMNYAFHSQAMDVVRDDLLRSLSSVKPIRPRIPFYSSVSGRYEPEACLDVDYWWQNLRQPVLFAPAIEELIRDGYDTVIEIGPHPALRAYFTETASLLGASLTVLPALRRKEDEPERILSTVGALYAIGYPVDFSSRYASGCMISLPTHPFLRERHWNEPAEAAQSNHGRIVHPLLGRRVESQRPEWRVELDVELHTWVRDHVVGGSVVFPGAGYLEQGLAAAHEVLGEGVVSLEYVEIEKALVLEPGAKTLAVVTFDPEVHSFTVRSGPDGRTLHAKGELFLAQESPPNFLPVAELRARCSECWDQAELYQRLAQRGLALGPAFQGIAQVWRTDGEALALITLPTPLTADGEAGRHYRFHPALLDACLQTIFAVGLPGTLCYLPIALRQFVVYDRIPIQLLSHVRLHRSGNGSLSADVMIASVEGHIVAELKQIILRSVDLGAQHSEELVHSLVWEPRSRTIKSAVTRESADTLALAATNRSGYAREQLVLYHERTLPAENALCAQYVAAALIQLGFCPQVAEQFTTAELVERLGVSPRYLRQLDRMLGFLGEDGFLGKGSVWSVLRPLPAEDLTAHFQELWSAFPASHAHLELTHRVGLRLAAILGGKLDPLAEIFSETSSATMEEIYDSSPVQWYGNATTRAVLTRLVDGLPPGRRADVLEIGAGTGGLSAWLLPLLAPDKGRYRFTDISDAFLPAARARFGEFSFVDYDTLNVETPEERHLTAPADLVVASNVLHATRDVRETLTNIRRLVRPGGCAVFVELSPGVRVVELVYGLLPGWWRIQDEVQRPYGPLLSPAAWQALAKECGFDEVALAMESEFGKVMSVVVARVAAQAPQMELPAAEQRGTWLLVPARNGLGERVAAALDRAGARVIYDIAAANGELAGIVNLSGIDAGDDQAPAAGLATVEQCCLLIADLLRTVTERSWKESPRLFLVTRGARAVSPGECHSFAQAALWGLGRSVMIEHPALRCTLIDLDPAGGDDAEAQRIATELLSSPEVPLEQAIALRAEERLVERLMQPSPDEVARDSHPDTPGRSVRLEVMRPGSLSGLALVEVSRPAPSHGEVELEVHAAALNFRDVMLALDILPSRESPPQLGLECSGRITSVGAGVVDFRAGEEVMAITSGTFGRYAIAKAGALLRKPPAMSHTEATTIPSAFATAVYALHHLGRMRAGERLLVHGAAGALGLAAVQLALQAGVLVYATAGTKEKRELLRELGATLVMDSRALDFGEEILRATAGEGVDLVLNSLSGEALVKSLAVLKPLGRFLEVGKRDFFENSRFGWRLLQQRSYHGIDLDKVVAAGPQVLKEIIDDVQRRIDAGALRPLPHRVFPLARAAEAFRTMQRSRHVGKLVIETREPVLRVHQAAAPSPIRRDGTYLITGGLGGLGLALADWLGREGAGRLVLIGRSEPTPDARRAIQEVERTGAQVVVMRADVASETELARVLSDIRGHGPPLRGVFHAAMVLDDAILLNLTPERIEKVMGPKARGALFLHEQTKVDPLELFVCCSSLAGILGNAGQAIYGAANTYLDALCQHRRACGLPALAVSFGAIADVGFVARTAGLTAALAARGMRSFPVREAMLLLGRFLRTKQAHVGLFRYDWSRYPSTASALVINLVAPKEDETPVETKDNLRERLRVADKAERRALLHERLNWHISRILGINGKRLDPDTSLAAMGMDSLMAVDLHRFIETSVGAEVPVMSILQGLSIAELAKEIDRKLDPRP